MVACEKLKMLGSSLYFEVDSLVRPEVLDVVHDMLYFRRHSASLAYSECCLSVEWEGVVSVGCSSKDLKYGSFHQWQYSIDLRTVQGADQSEEVTEIHDHARLKSACTHCLRPS